jgi:Secretion system C-terminal sorting domain
MQNIVVLVIALFVMTNSAIAQPNDSLRDRIWPFGYDCRVFNPPDSSFGVKHLDFNINPPVLSRVCPNIIAYDFTNASICDTLGNIILTTNGCTLEDGHGNVIVNAFNIDGNNVFFCPDGRHFPQCAMILPRPERIDEYVLFNLGLKESHVPPPNKYSELSAIGALHLNPIRKNATQNWQVQYGTPPVLADTLSFGRIVACRHGNGRDWWVTVPKLFSNRYHKFMVTAHPQTAQGQNTGVDYIGYQEIGHSLYDAHNFGQACFSPNGRYYVRSESKYSSGWGPSGMEIVLFDFDRCTGDFSNPRYWANTNPRVFTGVAFSENSRYLYVSTDSIIMQMDMQQQPLHFDTVAVWNGAIDVIFSVFFSVLQLAPDGKIYGGSSANRFIHVIENPNVGGMGCNVVQGGLSLGVYNAWGVPHYPYFRLGREVGSGCDTVYLRSEELRIEEGMKVWPNPAQNMLNIQILHLLPPDPQRGREVRLAITDVLGRVVYEEEVVEETISLDVGGWVSGLYFVSLKTEKGIVFSKKVIIER